MFEKFAELSIEERREAFLSAWASGAGRQFVDGDAKAAYQYRTGLIKDAIQLKKSPDRVPVMPIAEWAVTRLAGVTAKQAMYDPELRGKAFVEYCTKYQPDSVVDPFTLAYGPPLEILGYKLYKWAGQGVDENSGYQFIEKAYMQDDEYDHFISDMSDYLMRVWLPRTFEGLTPLADTLPLHGTFVLQGALSWLVGLGAPPVQEALTKLLEASKATFQWFQANMAAVMQTAGMGFPTTYGCGCVAPFDVLADSFRGTTEIMMDLYRRPEKVLAATEQLLPCMIKQGIMGSRATFHPIVFIPLHKGADGFMSNEQYEKFYWPTLKALCLGLIENGCVPYLFVEGSYNQRLQYLAELPQASCIFHFDRTDMTEARNVLGGKNCIAGGFPVSTILTGTPEQVEIKTKELIDTAAGDGGYILTIGTSMDECREDTLMAFIEAGKAHGKY